MGHKSPEENKDIEYLSVTRLWLTVAAIGYWDAKLKGSLIQHGVLVKYRRINWSKRSEEH